MFSGLKFIPRDQIDGEQREKGEDARKDRKKSNKRKDKTKKIYCSSSDDDSSRKRIRLKKTQQSKEIDCSSSSSSSGEFDREGDNCKRIERKRPKKGKKMVDDEDSVGPILQHNAGDNLDIKRKEIGLEWMFRPKEDMARKSKISLDLQPDEGTAEEAKNENPKELNPYLKDNGTGYPDDKDVTAKHSQLLSSACVGDGGASWRLKALKRAREFAAREGRKLEEVVEERWGSLGQLAVSVASGRAATSHAHLHAIKSRKKGLNEEQLPESSDQNQRLEGKNINLENQKDARGRYSKMKVPKFHDSLSWGKGKGQNRSTNDTGLVSSAISSLNKFANDGSFMREVMHKQNTESSSTFSSSFVEHRSKVDSDFASSQSDKFTEEGTVKKPITNQLAAKVLQLRMKGKHEEAEKLLKEADNVPVQQSVEIESSRLQRTSSSVMKRKTEDDADMHLAKKILRNQQYSLSGRADDEYDFDEDSIKKSRKKKGSNDNKSMEISQGRRLLTQQERCQFCFENPSRPMHLVIAIANFTYLTLPQWEQVVPGHCCILPMQHEAATRTVDNNVWDEIRNFKKCLIMMFAKQEKDLVFIETVVGLARQRRHCLIECIPLPSEVAKQAPLYFKKAIDEAEDEWSQHNAKKLIDTSEKGLRGSIPKDFPYFHVEFGLDKGFVHVIEDEQQFRSNFGINVVRGMLRLPAEDMHGRHRLESVEKQKQAVSNFVQDWDPYDWTRQLD